MKVRLFFVFSESIMNVSRREVIKIGAGSLVAAAFMNHAAGIASAMGPLEDKIESWKKRLGDVSSQLGNGKISGLQWQEEMDRIYGDTPIADLLKMIQFDDLKESILEQDLKGQGEHFLDIAIPGVADAVNGAEPDRVLISKLAYVKKGRNIPPHGHCNMVSAFLCVSGDFQVRLFDKVEEGEDDMVVRQTLDEKHTTVGTWSSISDYKSNVHWLTANSDNCFLFTCKLIRIDPQRTMLGRINIDLRDPKVVGSNTFRANKISFQQAAELY
jgi:hypothetical protein